MSADEGDAPDATRGVEHRLLRLDRVAGRALRLWPLGGLRRGQTWVGELAVVIDRPAPSQAAERPQSQRPPRNAIKAQETMLHATCRVGRTPYWMRTRSCSKAQSVAAALLRTPAF